MVIYWKKKTMHVYYQKLININIIEHYEKPSIFTRIIIEFFRPLVTEYLIFSHTVKVYFGTFSMGCITNGENECFFSFSFEKCEPSFDIIYIYSCRCWFSVVNTEMSGNFFSRCVMWWFLFIDILTWQITCFNLIEITIEFFLAMNICHFKNALTVLLTFSYFCADYSIYFFNRRI